MPRLAFYRVVTDVTELNLPTGEGSHPFHEELTFKTTDDVELNESDLRPLLCFQMDPSNNASRKLEVFIRDLAGADRKICTWNLGGGAARWTMEPVKSEWVRKGENKLIFKVDDDGAGSVVIRNVVFFFHRYVH